MENHEVVIIGAGPAGAVAAGLLRRQGHQVLVLERQRFPRFSIGESLLAHCIEFIDEAGMLPAVQAEGFQLKNGAAFAWGDRYTAFDFRDKFSPGPGTTFQVLRSRFDQILADEAARLGAEVRYEQEVVAADFSGTIPVLSVRDASIIDARTRQIAGVADAPSRQIASTADAPIRQITDVSDASTRQISARFVLDASGYGRVLARLLDLERPSGLPPRKALFTHIEDRIDDPSFDREKILISVHGTQPDIWYWLIPFSNGRCSLGVVGAETSIGDAPDKMFKLRELVEAAPNLKRLLVDAVWDTPANAIDGYAASVVSLHGPGYALLGNAAEFLDPVFSSGVTIAMHSAKLATDALHRQLRGEYVNWQREFADPLMLGVETFRTYVEGWYTGAFRDVVFYERAQPDIRRMISSILAGYAWDRNNPYVAEHARRLRTLAEICTLNTAAVARKMNAEAVATT